EENSKHVWGKNIFRALFYMPSMIPLVATVLIWNGVFNEHTGWINLFLENVLGIPALGVEGIRWTQNPRLIYFTYTGMGLWGIGSAMMIYLAGLQGVPTELYDAATVDGAGWWARLRHVTLPMISPVIFYQLILSLIGLLQYFLAPFVLNRGDGSPQGTTRFIMVYFYKQAFTFFNMGYGAALAWALFIVALILTIALFASAKYWVYYGSGEES
ncbi:MAG: sugar ABC transporter permease, partial [Anaerolineae bacterium]|nr:sugar ABC transporter permease [Anaerolineae bacterium]